MVVYFKHLVKDNPNDLERINELQDKVQDFVYARALIKENQINTEIGLKDAYSHLVPLIDMDVYIPHSAPPTGTHVVGVPLESS